MAATKRTQTQLKLDRVELTALLLKGWGDQEIAQRQRVSREQISYDVKVVHKRWRQSQLVNFNEARQREIARIDLIEREACEAWEHSKRPRKASRARRRQLPC